MNWRQKQKPRPSKKKVKLTMLAYAQDPEAIEELYDDTEKEGKGKPPAGNRRQIRNRQLPLT